MSGVDLVAFSTSNKVDWWMVAKQSYLSLHLNLTLMQLSNSCVNVDDLCLNVHLLACDTVLGRLEAESTKALHQTTQTLPSSDQGTSR